MPRDNGFDGHNKDIPITIVQFKFVFQAKIANYENERRNRATWQYEVTNISMTLINDYNY